MILTDLERKCLIFKTLQLVALKSEPKGENNRKVEGHFVWTVSSPLIGLEYRSRCLKISTERALSIKKKIQKNLTNGFRDIGPDISAVWGQNPAVERGGAEGGHNPILGGRTP